MSIRNLGYQRLTELLGLRVRPLPRVAIISRAVNRKKITSSQILFPDGVAYEDTPVGHLEFALRHEELNLEVIAAAFAKIEPSNLRDRYAQAPNGEFIRKACYLWEWMRGQPIDQPARTNVAYTTILDPEKYATAKKPARSPKYRIEDNLLGNSDFCPIVSREAINSSSDLSTLIQSVETQLKELSNRELYSRAIQYLFFSETKGSFAIERETPSAGKEDRFVQLLTKAGTHDEVTEDWLVELQNAVVRDDFSFEASFRVKQNWLEDGNARVTFIPPSPENLQRLMRGWARFTNDKEKEIPFQAKLACSAFGFIYLHPFMDGNGRLHRFLIHHLLAQSGMLAQSMIVPVSATILRQMMPEYAAVLTGFSGPTTKLWEYAKTDDGPHIRIDPGVAPYAYFNADNEVRFLHEAIKRTITEEIPKELRFLAGYDEAASRIEERYDLPNSEISKLIRMIEGNNGVLSSNKRKQFPRLPEKAIKKIEEIVRDSFEISGPRQPSP